MLALQKRSVALLSAIFLSFQFLSAQTVDVKVSSVKIPAANSVIRSHQSFIPSAVIGNLGSETIAAVPVRCEIMNISGSIVYLSDQTIWFLPPHEELPVIFDAATEGLPAGAYSFRVSLLLVNDANSSNDRITGTFFTIWDSAASMNIARRGHTANLLNDGRVLVAGGEWPTLIYKTCEIYTPDVNNGLGQWDTTASMSATRMMHTATMLPDGRILVAGGMNASFGLEASCEIFDPAANGGVGAWKPTASMAITRSGHTATLLKNGKVLIAGGGTTAGTVSACELFDPAANNGQGGWSQCTAMNVARSAAAAVLLGDGRVLVTGGIDAGNITQTSCEVFDPMANNGKGSWTFTASMGSARGGHNAITLPTGKVLVTGGGTSTCEVYDPSGSGQWTTVGGISGSANTAALLSDGKVIVTGQYASECQIFDSEGPNGRWAKGPMLSILRSRYTSTVLSNGRVLVAGGGGTEPVSLASCELFNPIEVLSIRLPNCLSISSISPEMVTVHHSFSLVVESRDDSGRVQNVSKPTTVRLSVVRGTGSLVGVLAGIIPAGENTILFRDLAYDAAQDTLRVCVSAESGMDLLPDTSAAVFIGAASSPIAPKQLEADPGNLCARLTWQKNPEENIAKYLVFEGTQQDQLALVDSTASATDTSITISGLANDVLYYFSVAAVDSDHIQSPLTLTAEATPAIFSMRTLSGADSIGTGSIAWGDFNGDGRLDAVAVGVPNPMFYLPMFSTVYENAGHQMLHDISAPLVPVWTGQAAWFDYNNDNLLDILVAGSSVAPADPSVMRVYKNLGNNRFSEIGSSLFSCFPVTYACGDYDNDGKTDVIASAWTGSETKAILYHNEGGDKFAATTVAFPRLLDPSFAWVDVDNDGDLDLIVLNDNESWLVDLFRNDGPKADTGWTFTKINNQFQKFTGDDHQMAWGDYDNDGDLDVVMAGLHIGTGAKMATLYLNDGKGNFTDAHATGLPDAVLSVDCGDYDGDGRLDLAFGRESYPAPCIYHNNGNFDFSPAEGSPQTKTIYNVWGDIDNDNDLDLLALKPLTSGCYVPVCVQNNFNGINTCPSSPSGLRSMPTGHSVKLSWQRATDNETPSRGLSYNLSVGTTRGGCEIMSPMANLSTGKRYVARLGNVDEDTSWVIRNLPNGRYYWTVQAIDPSYTGSLFATVDSFTINVTEVGQEAIAAPRAYALAQNFPNPFNPSTTIRFSLPSRTHVSLKIYDALGREISTLVSEVMPSGTYSRQWNASGMPSGVYFYRLKAGAFTETRRLLLLK